MKHDHDSLLQSYEKAEDIMKNRAASFYQAFHLLPKKRFLGICAVYAFCRYADDISDGDLLKTEKVGALQKLEQNLRNIYTEHADQRSDCMVPWWDAFVDTVKKYQIPSEGFLNQIEGQKKDIDLKQIQTLTELLEYCRLVAGSVGVMLAPVLADYEKYPIDNTFIASCENLGIGMQITNILRDIGEDYKQRQRIYLPQKMLKKYGIFEAFFIRYITNGQKGQDLPESFIRLWEELAKLADGYYDGFKKELYRFLPEARFPLTTAALLYHGISEVIRRNNYDCLTQRCYTSKTERLSLILKAKKMIK